VLGALEVVEDQDEFRGIREGRLYPFLKDVGVYHCPADKRISVKGTNVYRTYSIPSCLNGGEQAKQIVKFDEIRRPAAKYMLVEEADMRECNVGPWSFGCKEAGYNPEKWHDPLAVWHVQSSLLGFCDGHAEVHIWRDKFTKERMDKIVRDGTTNYGLADPPVDQRTDLEYMAQGWPYYR
jgi:hypothetical protein